MRVLILEPHSTGHHASYLRWLVRAISRKNWSVVIATTEEAISHPALAGITSEFGDVEIYPFRESSAYFDALAGSSQLLWREIGYWQIFRRTVREVDAKSPVDLVILPYVDYCFYAMAILGAPFRRTPWCGISMRLAIADTTTAASRHLPWKWRMAKRLLASSKLKALFVINPSVTDVPSNWCTAKELSRLHYLPDPAEYEVADSRWKARATLGLANDKIAILVFGSIDERKGVDSLLAALAAQNDLASYVVILAGKQSPKMRKELLAPACTKMLSERRLIVFDQFVSEAELRRLLAASDVVWVGYRNHVYMSGVLVLAGKAGLPTVGTSQGEIGRLIIRHAMGAAARIDRPTEVAIALRKLLDGATRMEMGRRAKIAFDNHTVEGFGERVLSAFDT